MPHVVILGAGPCGMTAALLLSKQKDFSVTVIEKDDGPGGLCRSVENSGYRFDLGGHRFISSDQELINDVKGLLGSDLLVSNRKSAILFQNRTIEYPLNFENIFSNFDIVENTKILASYLKARFSVEKRDGTMGSWLEARFGQRLADTFFAPYSEKLWGIPVSELSADWAGQRISLLNLSDAILRTLKMKKGNSRTYAKQYYYPINGIGQIFEAMDEKTSAIGVRYLYNTKPLEFNVVKGKITEILVDEKGQQQSIRPDFIISTIPLPGLLELLPESLSKPIQEHKNSLFFRALRFVNLFLDQSDFSERTWTYVADPSCIFTRIQEPKRRSIKNAPEGKTSLILEIPCKQGDEVWKMPNQDLTELVLDQLESLQFPIRSNVTGSFSTWAEHAYPIYRMGYNKHKQSLLSVANSIPNLISCGRQGGFSYIFMDTAMVMGRLAAKLAIKAVYTDISLESKNNLLSMQNRKGLIEINSKISA